MNENQTIKDQEITESISERLDRLERENQALKQKLEVFGVKSDEFTKPLSIMDYYISKYIELNESVYKDRIKESNNHLLEYKKQYNDLFYQLNNADQQLKTASELEEMRVNLEKYKEEKQQQIKDNQLKLTNLINEIETSLSLANQYTNEYYENLIRHLGKASFDDTVEYMDFVLSVATNSLYDQNVEIANKIVVATKLNQENEDLEAEEKIESNKLQEEIKKIENEQNKVTRDSIEEELDKLENIITTFNNNEKELQLLFKELKQKHIKEICDKINHMQITDTSNKEIANILDDLIENNYAYILLSTDTSSNEQWKKNDELEKLKLKKAHLEQKQQVYQQLLSEYDNLQSMYEKINQNITQIEEYAEYALKAIEAYSVYLKIYDIYMSLIAKKEALEKDVDTLNYEIISLKETRRTKVLDPYARPIINELNENIALRESKLERSKVLLEKTIKELEDIAKTKEDTVLINVIKDKINCEKHLPDLYNKQRELSLSVEEKYNLVKEYQKELEEFDLIEEKINQLNNKE